MTDEAKTKDEETTRYRLRERGLEGIGADSAVALCEGGSPGAEFLRLTILQLREFVLAAGATAEELDQWDAVLSTPGRWFPGIAMVAAWGRRPPLAGDEVNPRH